MLLEAHPFGGGDVQAQQTLEELTVSGVHAQVSNPAFTYTHAKLLLVDGAMAYILTANLSRAGLGGNSISANREYGVVDADASDVAEVKAIFSADWDRTTPPASTYSQPRLVVSPVNARATLAALIASAQRTLLIQDEEMYDTASEDALIAAARRGVSVEVVPPPPSGSSSYAADVARLTAGGVHVRYLTAPYMHAKLVVADGALTFTGSENFSATSLDQNREVGIMKADPTALATFGHVFALDWALAADAR